MAATVVEKAFRVLELAKTKSVTFVQRHFRTRYGKPPPKRQSIYDWNKKFQETGCFIVTRYILITRMLLNNITKSLYL